MKIGPKYKICRRLGSRVFGKCQTTKFSISGSEAGRRGRGGPGGGRGRRRSSGDYGGQLLEKQKARYSYGLKEGQFVNYVKEARRRGGHNPVAALYQMLESRLDNAVYRLGWAPTRVAARQLVSHGHMVVNGRRVNVPSFRLKPGDTLGFRTQSLNIAPARLARERSAEYQPPEWLQVTAETPAGKVAAPPVLDPVVSDINFGSILEFYGRV